MIKNYFILIILPHSLINISKIFIKISKIGLLTSHCTRLLLYNFDNLSTFTLKSLGQPYYWNNFCMFCRKKRSNYIAVCLSSSY